MTYSYQGPLTYGPQQNGVYYDNMTYQKPSAAPAAIAGGVIGGGVGAILGCRKKTNPFKNGEVTDTFAKSVYEKYIDKAADSGKEAYNGGLNILKKIDSVKNPDELKVLFSENAEVAKEICTELNKSPEEFLSQVTKDNLSKNKKTIKEKIIAGNNTRYRDMKNQIEACWDKEAKKVVKNDNVKEDIYKIVKKSTGGIQGKVVAKYAAIGAVITGIFGYIGAKLFIR